VKTLNSNVIHAVIYFSRNSLLCIPQTLVQTWRDSISRPTTLQAETMPLCRQLVQTWLLVFSKAFGLPRSVLKAKVASQSGKAGSFHSNRNIF
jgi:hypothetical protein